MSGIYGTKYAGRERLDIKEVAKLVRADIKAAPELKGFKVGVTIKRFSGQVGQSMTIDVKSVPEGFKLLRRSRLYRELNGDQRFDREEPYLSDAALAVNNKLEAIMGAYNYDRGDIQSDYFDQNFYAHVSMPNTAADREAFIALMASNHEAAEREAKGEAVTSALTPPVKMEPYMVQEAEYKRIQAMLEPAAMTGVPQPDPDTVELLKAKKNNQAEFMAAMGCS